MAQVRSWVRVACCVRFLRRGVGTACLRCGATRGHEAHRHGCIIGRMERTPRPPRRCPDDPRLLQGSRCGADGVKLFPQERDL